MERITPLLHRPRKRAMARSEAQVIKRVRDGAVRLERAVTMHRQSALEEWLTSLSRESLQVLLRATMRAWEALTTPEQQQSRLAPVRSAILSHVTAREATRSMC